MSVDNESCEAQSGWLVVGVYNSAGTMIGVKDETLTDVMAVVNSKISTISLGTNSADDVAVVRAMLWDNTSDFMPYHDVVEIGLF